MKNRVLHRHFLNAPRSRRRGQTIVEFAFAVPILIAMLVGILEFAWITKSNMTLASAAREGARVAALGRNATVVTERVNRYGSPLKFTSPDGSISLQQCDSSGANCTAWPADNANGTNGVRPPSMVRVTLTTKHTSLTKMIPGLNNRALTATAMMRRES